MMAKGILSWIPGIRSTFYNRSAAEGTNSSSYCYGVWLKHLTLLWANGMRQVPRTVLELGPGASIGTGVAALLSGAERYIAIDAVAHMQRETNEKVLRELVDLFKSRAPRPRAGFPSFDEFLDARLFPSGLLNDEQMNAALEPSRLARIQHAVRTLGTPDSDGTLRYHTWNALEPIPEKSVDMLFSHVVLNHVPDIDSMYATCGRLVRSGGWMSHQTDFGCLNTASEWNGHLGYGDLTWKVITGNRPYFINRESVTRHVELLGKHGFDVVKLIRGHQDGGIDRSQLAPRWRGISDEDLHTATAFIVSRRR